MTNKSIHSSGGNFSCDSALGDFPTSVLFLGIFAWMILHVAHSLLFQFGLEFCMRKLRVYSQLPILLYRLLRGYKMFSFHRGHLSNCIQFSASIFKTNLLVETPCKGNVSQLQMSLYLQSQVERIFKIKMLKLLIADCNGSI